MTKGRTVGLAGMVLTVSALGASDTHAQPVTISPDAMPRIAAVDERFQSYNVEMAEVIGARFWRPYAERRERTTSGEALADNPEKAFQRAPGPDPFEARPPTDLKNSRLRKLAAALGPAYIRVSGSWANSVYFARSDEEGAAPPPKGFTDVLTAREWAGVVDFSRAADAKLVTSFAISDGVRDAAGAWTSEQAGRLLAYTASIGGHIAAAEFFNEPSFATRGGAPPTYNAADYARDFAIFRQFARKAAPDMRIVGPGSVAEGVWIMPGPLLKTADLLAAHPRPVFEVFSYHSYAAVSGRCASRGEGAGTMETAALSEEWLARPDRINAIYEDLRDRFEPNKPVWVTETADAACGGNPWAATFRDSFRYLDQLGRLAQRGVQVVFHNTLASSDYGLIDEDTETPRPNYWAAVLWRRLMGTTVLDPGSSRSGLHLYAQCLLGHPGGVALLAISTDETKPQSIEVPMPADRYTLTARQLDDDRVRLNGHDLALTASGDLPPITGERIHAGAVDLSPASLTFLAIGSAQNRDCQ